MLYSIDGRLIFANKSRKEQTLKNIHQNKHSELFASDAKKPKYGQIQDSILAHIEKGEWAPGDRVPAERKLARMYDASVGTVRNAMQSLVNEGYLSRKQGRGTFVNKSTEHTDSLRYFRFVADFDGVVQPLTIKCIKEPRLKVIPEVAGILGLSADSEFFEVNRLFCLEPDPLVYVTTYLPQTLFRDFGNLSIQVLEEIPIYLLVESKYNMPTLGLKERFSAVVADDKVAEMLLLNPGAPVQKIVMVASTTRNTLYEYQDSNRDTTTKQIYRDCPGHQIAIKNIANGASYEF